MIRQENPNFKASRFAPNPLEVTYWIDLTADPDGGMIKIYNGSNWKVISAGDSEISEKIDNIESQLDNKVSSNEVVDIKVMNELPESPNDNTLYVIVNPD